MDRPDKVAAFKASIDAQLAYREAYFAAQHRDPKSVEGLPHPDTAPDGTDFAAALARLREPASANRIEAVPPRDVRS